MASHRDINVKEENPFESFIVDMLMERMQGMSSTEKADLIFLLHGRVDLPSQGLLTWH